MSDTTAAPAGILLKRPGFYRQLTSPEHTAWVFDPASIPFLTEELIARSVVTLGIPASSPAVPFIKGLTPFLQQRIKVLDENRRVNDKTGALLSPIVEALGGKVITRTGPVPVAALWIPTDVPEQLRVA